MVVIMVNALLRHHHFNYLPQWCARIQIPVILRKSAGTNLQANTMTNFENLRGVPTINRVMVDLARLDQRWPIHTIAKTGSYHAITEMLSETMHKLLIIWRFA